MYGMRTAAMDWRRKRCTAKTGRSDCDAIYDVVSFFRVVHLGSSAPQEIVPLVELVLPWKVTRDALDQTLAKHRVGDHLLTKVVHGVRFSVTSRESVVKFGSVAKGGVGGCYHPIRHISARIAGRPLKSSIAEERRGPFRIYLFPKSLVNGKHSLFVVVVENPFGSFRPFVTSAG